MGKDSLCLTFRGVRGSAPTPDPQTLRHGGHTTCLDVAITPIHRLVLDCGSGLRKLQQDLPPDPGAEGYRFDVFLSHFHSDHLEGLRFFSPLYESRSRFFFHGFPSTGVGLREALEVPMRAPWFPVQFPDTASTKEFIELTGEPVSVADIVVSSAPVGHPQGAAGYRLQRAGRAIAFVTDSEPGDQVAEAAVADLVRGVDVLIHDAQFTRQEYERSYRGWGHSSWQRAVEVARAAGAGRLILFHHDPARTDDALDEIVQEARGEFADLDAAREGMTLEL